MTKHAVLTGNTLLSIQGNTWNTETIDINREGKITYFASMALAKGFTHLWIMPDSEIIGNDSFIEYDRVKWDLKFSIDTASKLMKSCYGWRLPSGGQKDITVIFPRNTRWTFARECNPKQLLVTICYLEKILGVPIAGSPSTAGWKLINEVCDKAGLKMPEIDLSKYHFGAEAAHDLIGTRPMLPGEESKPYLLKFDMSSAYLHGVSSNDSFIGVGTPVHDEVTRFDFKTVGVWRVRIYDDCILPGMPPILDTKRKRDAARAGQLWLATPIVRLLQATGHEVEILESWTFPGKKLLLQPWASLLWNARVTLASPSDEYRRDDCRVYAGQAIKQIAVATVGLTAYRKFEEAEYTEKKRPDIRMVAVARCVEVIYHNLLKIKRIHGVTPVMYYMDAVYFLADTPDGRAAYPEIVAREGKLGGFKFEGAIKVTSEVTEILTVKMSTGDRLEQLNKIGWK